MSEKNKELMPNLTNKVTLAGKLMELSPLKQGTTSNGVAYLSFNGLVQCGESNGMTARFKTFVKAKKTNGEDSKLYPNVIDWYNKAVPATNSPEQATMVEMVGTLADNPYVNAQNKLVESTQYNMTLFNEFKDYAAQIDLAGYIYALDDEIIDDEATGRKRMRLISRDAFGNTLDIKSIIIPEDMVDGVNGANWEAGATVLARTELQMYKSKPKEPTGNSFGKEHTYDGKEYIAMTVVGGESAYEDTRALEASLVKTAMNERGARLKEIEVKGYQGTKTPGTTSTTSFSKPASSTAATTVNEEDIPF